MTRDEHIKFLLEKAYKLGFEYERDLRGCSQCALAAVYDTLDIWDERVFKSSTGFAGGGGLTGMSVCGGYAAGVMVISQLYGRERSNFSDPERLRFKNFKLVERFTKQFIDELHSIICRDIHAQIFDRPYFIADSDEYRKFEEAGGHVDKCTGVVGKASKVIVKFILDEGLVKLPLPGHEE
ncbi:MAG: C_GCAxxG_C_C family protein [Deltaproteobacteria bacterium]|nr:C_GCAxxG_C_C family protein [Deltaproteobacteria bacterium]MBW1931060.1 C_GCAxxG_C_C family protein [Deltaproteobacteria bacterium]MBW2025129.1 C_GCAxxG_C_C family protein [Deltaproteobacteria bacterium]MBW2125085.1 C_GCAxxG_C_C family protein [Deltaproteobacteria bacterium]